MTKNVFGYNEAHPLRHEPHKFRLYRVPLNNGGYTSNGYYYGAGAPLYCLECDCGAIQEFVRPHNRVEAKREAQKIYVNASFYR